MNKNMTSRKRASFQILCGWVMLWRGNLMKCLFGPLILCHHIPRRLGVGAVWSTLHYCSLLLWTLSSFSPYWRWWRWKSPMTMMRTVNMVILGSLSVSYTSSWKAYYDLFMFTFWQPFSVPHSSYWVVLLSFYLYFLSALFCFTHYL